MLQPFRLQQITNGEKLNFLKITVILFLLYILTQFFNQIRQPDLSFFKFSDLHEFIYEASIEEDYLVPLRRLAKLSVERKSRVLLRYVEEAFQKNEVIDALIFLDRLVGLGNGSLLKRPIVSRLEKIAEIEPFLGQFMLCHILLTQKENCPPIKKNIPKTEKQRPPYRDYLMSNNMNEDLWLKSEMARFLLIHVDLDSMEGIDGKKVMEIVQPLLRTGQAQLAENALKTCFLQKMDSYEECLVGLMKLYSQINKKEELVRLFENNFGSGFPGVALERAKFLRKSGHYQEALLALKKMGPFENYDDLTGELYLELGRALIASEKYPEARKLLEESALGKYFGSHFNLGRDIEIADLYFYLGDKRKVEAYLKKIIKMTEPLEGVDEIDPALKLIKFATLMQLSSGKGDRLNPIIKLKTLRIDNPYLRLLSNFIQMRKSESINELARISDKLDIKSKDLEEIIFFNQRVRP